MTEFEHQQPPSANQSPLSSETGQLPLSYSLQLECVKYGYPVPYILLHAGQSAMQPWKETRPKTALEALDLVHGYSTLSLAAASYAGDDDLAKSYLESAINIARVAPENMPEDTTTQLAFTAARLGDFSTVRQFMHAELRPLTLPSEVVKGEYVSDSVLYTLINALAARNNLREIVPTMDLIRSSAMPAHRAWCALERFGDPEQLAGIETMLQRGLKKDNRWTYPGQVELARIRLYMELERNDVTGYLSSERQSIGTALSTLGRITEVQLEYGKEELARQTVKRAVLLIMDVLQPNENARNQEAAHPQFWLERWGLLAARSGAGDEMDSILQTIQRESFHKYVGDPEELRHQLLSKVTSAHNERFSHGYQGPDPSIRPLPAYKPRKIQRDLPPPTDTSEFLAALEDLRSFPIRSTTDALGVAQAAAAASAAFADAGDLHRLALVSTPGEQSGQADWKKPATDAARQRILQGLAGRTLHLASIATDT